MIFPYENLCYKNEMDKMKYRNGRPVQESFPVKNLAYFIMGCYDILNPTYLRKGES
jgi:hypothetical protein